MAAAISPVSDRAIAIVFIKACVDLLRWFVSVTIDATVTAAMFDALPLLRSRLKRPEKV
ncbi:MAG: hypothetical protein WBG92_02355 [Thiohalocapsa sp.]